MCAGYGSGSCWPNDVLGIASVRSGTNCDLFVVARQQNLSGLFREPLSEPAEHFNLVGSGRAAKLHEGRTCAGSFRKWNIVQTVRAVAAQGACVAAGVRPAIVKRDRQANRQTNGAPVVWTPVSLPEPTHLACASVTSKNKPPQPPKRWTSWHPVAHIPKNSRSGHIYQDVLLKNTRPLPLLLHRMGVAAKSRKRTARNVIGARVKEARRRLDPPLTQDQLAGRLAGEGIQLDRVALAKVECGLRCAFDFEVKGLATVLRVDANWLLGIGAGAPPSGGRTTQRGKARA